MYRSGITDGDLQAFYRHLSEEEKAPATVRKYVRDVLCFRDWLENGGLVLDREAVLAYKRELCGRFAPASVNAALASLNSFFACSGRHGLRVRTVRVQRKIFTAGERELRKEEYTRLLRAAQMRNNERLYLLMQTICSTGIRVSEHRYITVEAVRLGRAEICCKGKTRCVFLPAQLCRMLQDYICKHGITGGSVFVSRNGKPLDRSNIWTDMKRLCRYAGISERKVFPHNLRHLFARTYYAAQKDIVRLADILGHASIDTTRIYTAESGETHRRQLQRLGLLQITT